MDTNIFFGIWIFYVIAILILYHKMFDVVYLDFFRGVMKELVFAAIGGMILAGITVKYWYVSAVIIIIVGLVCRAKVDDPDAKTGVMVVVIIIAIVISVLGAKMSKNVKQKNVNNKTAVSQENQHDFYSDYEMPI